MKNSALLLTSLALCCSTAYAASDVTYSGNTLHMPHVSYKGALYDVTMTFKAPDKLILTKAKPLMTVPDSPVVAVSEELSFNLAEIMVGAQGYRADIAPMDADKPGNEFTASFIMPSFIGKAFPGDNVTGLGAVVDNSFDGFSWRPRISDDGKFIAAYAGTGADSVATPILFNPQSGQMQVLGALEGGPSRPSAINNHGAMTGIAKYNFNPDKEGKPDVSDSAYYTIDGMDIIHIGALEEGRTSKAFGINNHGVGVGWTTTKADDSGHTAFMYDPDNGMSALTADVLEGQLSFAFDINDAGQICGVTTTAEGASLAFIYKDGDVTTLGSLDDSGFSEARAINDKGWTTGFSDEPDASTHAFIHDGTSMNKIEGINGDSKGVDINTHGHVVGTYTDNIDGSKRIFVYKEGMVRDLYDSLSDADKANWKDFYDIHHIADDGTITGSGRYYVDKAAKKWLWMGFTLKL
ncbi:MAG: DUF3466 family protein [Methyloprofundus sp.]|nr:DUF3466 family protein [Methyloprofundus sp.]